MKETTRTCPYCGAQNCGQTRRGWGYLCPECIRLFNDEDIERERLRHELWALLEGTDENNPKHCDIAIGEQEAQGLSSLELPRIGGLHQFQDGTMWYAFVGEDWANDDSWRDIDTLSIEDLKTIVNELSNQ
jgi:hypothetical protein